MTRPEIRKHIADIEALEGLEEHVDQVARKAVTASTRLDEAYEKLANERDDLQAEVAKLDSANQDQASTIRDLTAARAQRLPREIKKSEVKEGQTVAYRNYNNPQEWKVEEMREGDWFGPLFRSTIILLEDAPAKPVPSKRPAPEDSPILVFEVPGRNLVGPHICSWSQTMKRWESTVGSWFASSEVQDWSRLIEEEPKG